MAKAEYDENRIAGVVKTLFHSGVLKEELQNRKRQRARYLIPKRCCCDPEKWFQAWLHYSTVHRSIPSDIL